MGEYAPDALVALGRRLAAALGGELSGVLGDASHTYGYHRARAVLPADDYSVQLPDDQLGDAWAASALDVSLPPDMMRTVTRRLLDSALDENDPRLNCAREFFGTLDGTTVTGYDCVERHYSSSDDSHLWHVHISILRRYANDPAALAQVEAVYLGQPVEVPDVNLTDPITVPNWDKDPRLPAAGEHSDVATALAVAQQRSWQAYRTAQAIEAKLDALAAKVGQPAAVQLGADQLQAVIDGVTAKISDQLAAAVVAGEARALAKGTA